MARTASLYRSVTLFRAFLREQTDPDLFYGVLAADSARQVGEYVSLAGATVLDVGGGPGYFAEAFRGAGATYVGLEPDAGEMVARGKPEPGTVRGSGEALPVRTAAVDVCYSSNVLEHVRSPWTMTAEMVRVTRPGGRSSCRSLRGCRPGAATRRLRGTTSAATVPAVATAAGTGASPRTGSASRCSRSPSVRRSGGPGRVRTSTSSLPSRATTRGGPPGSWPFPACARS